MCGVNSASSEVSGMGEVHGFARHFQTTLPGPQETGREGHGSSQGKSNQSSE